MLDCDFKEPDAYEDDPGVGCGLGESDLLDEIEYKYDNELLDPE